MQFMDILIVFGLAAIVFLITSNFPKEEILEVVDNDENNNEDAEFPQFEKNVWQPIIEMPLYPQMIDIGTPNYRDAWKNY